MSSDGYSQPSSWLYLEWTTIQNLERLCEKKFFEKVQEWWFIPLISGARGKQISKFKASLVQSIFQVKKSLGPGVVGNALNDSTQETE